MWDTFFYRGAIVISAVPGLIGINSMLRPEATLKIVKFPIPVDPQSRKTCLSLARLQGARNIVISYLFINNALTGDKKLMGMGLLGALFMLATDGGQWWTSSLESHIPLVLQGTDRASVDDISPSPDLVHPESAEGMKAETRKDALVI
ncbi:integral membrane protein [Fusarium pseudoanthophilum]|uniref:Integral membrane protein n=1 Tax=Fusarium pseudoanthophilum TaxID=48495 RepID=A0A8H5KHG6_9HYPO|nr:integral membrane protein [Fusarium pseudoanthophilum]